MTTSRSALVDDETIRTFVLWTLALVFAAGFAGGWIYRVSGLWLDGARTVRLSQFGPFVWGRCALKTGHQQFSGYIIFGRLKLKRRDFGADHLRSLGFGNTHVASMQGAATGFFKMRLGDDGQLRGHFYGRTFAARDNKMVPTTLAAPQPRIWQRSDANGTLAHA